MTRFIKSLWDIDSNHLPTDEVNTQFYKNALNVAQNYLFEAFDNGADAVELIALRCEYVDQVLQQIWQHYFTNEPHLSLIAVGGYGRGELYPHSDVDLLILMDESIADNPPAALSDFLTALWDTGLEIGQSVRTVKECQEQAETDISTATNLLESRFLTGNQALFDQLQELTDVHRCWDTKLFFEQKKLEQKQRHHKFYNSANNLEPNIKESPGGLRDIQVISWVAQQHFGVNDIHGLMHKGFIASNEYDTLENAHRFLAGVRFLLHYQAGRKEERLMIDFQRKLAERFGYQGNNKNIAVEYFMRDYYRCARSVGQMNDLLLQIFEENIILADEPQQIEPLNRRFQINNGYLETINAGIFAFRPYAMLELFLLLQQNPTIKGVRADTIRQLHAHIDLIDDNFRKDIKSKSLFMEICRQPNGITHEFRRMNKLGVLGAYLPEFGKIVGQMQHDLFHAYTVDEHTLFLVANLRRFSCKEFEHEFPLCSDIFKQLPKPELIYITGLYHDIAKGRGGDHSVLGVEDAKQFCERHSISKYDTELISFLIRHHLLMSSTAQRQDIDDPEVIKAFADIVGNINRLNHLYLLTVADIRATNINLWNGWRDSLLKQLYNSTFAWLENNENQAKSVEEKAQRNYSRALEELVDEGFLKAKVEELWQAYNQDYFLRHTIDDIVWQTEFCLTHIDETTIVNIRHHKQHKTQEIFIKTKDKPGVFAAITSCLEQLQLDIFDAKINTAQEEVLNTFIVANNTLHDEEIKHALLKQLDNPNEAKAYIPQIIPRTMKLFETKPTLNFNTNNKHQHTTVELFTHDRPGLVSAVAQAFLQTNTQLIDAKLTTLGDQVEDVFIVCTDKGEPLNVAETTKLELKLQEVLQ
jgi:[protein-PII] uridylyltransferase